MSVPRPKSPRPVPPSLKEDKEETIWEKIGTLGRKKRIKEGKDFQYFIFVSKNVTITNNSVSRQFKKCKKKDVMLLNLQDLP